MSRTAAMMNNSAIKNNMQDLQQRMEANEAIDNYLTAQREWAQFSQELLSDISKELRFSVLQTMSGCC